MKIGSFYPVLQLNSVCGIIKSEILLDTATGRFLSPDTTSVLTATPMALTDKKLYAYCDDNPITRVDHGGEFWEDLVVDVYECERFDVGGLGGPLGSSAYNTYAIYSKTSSYNAKFGGYYHGKYLLGE